MCLSRFFLGHASIRYLCRVVSEGLGTRALRRGSALDKKDFSRGHS